MLCSGSHETFDGDMRCFYHSQLAVAGKEGVEFAKQKGHDACHLIIFCGCCQEEEQNQQQQDTNVSFF